MLWDKTRYLIRLNGGCGRMVTSPMHGLVKHLIVVPENKDTIWSMFIKDKAGDIIYQVTDQEGRLDDKQGLPVGLDSQENLDIEIYDTTANDLMTVIFKVQELR